MFRRDEDDGWDYCHKCTYGYTCDNCRIAQGRPSNEEESRLNAINDGQTWQGERPFWIQKTNSGQDFVDEDPNCPVCGGDMILKKRKDGSKSFFGCKKFPKCKGSRSAY